MLVRTLLVLAAGLVTAQLISALPLDSDSLESNTLLKQESEQLTTSLESSGAAPVVREKRTIGFLRQLFPTLSQNADENAVAESKIAPVVVRKTRQAPAAAAEEEEEYEDDDQALAASNDNEVAQSAEEDADVEDSDSAETEDQRDKRFSGGTGGSGSGGGSGNFLFDIIRLVAGSGTTQNQDEADNAPLDENATHAGEAKHDDGYSAGVPGPLTRLFVIANRGIANLIQDLILRLAQTSERIVNFKARLITSII